ncbi:MAG TPA: DinB family protein [Vicinamibacterales bacterium]|nr:DinB family protein [Vicinamibacterales bacterium]
MPDDKALRAHLASVLDWSDAHATFDAAVKGLPPKLRGVVPQGWAYSAWQLLEHLRMAQEDILQFCVARTYKEKKWPEQYWPTEPAPPNAAAWNGSIAAFRRDRKALQQLAGDPRVELTAVVPHGTTQTYLRELLLVADHNAYHIGQLVALRKQLGAWT